MEIQRFLERREKDRCGDQERMGREKRDEARMKETALKATANTNAVGVRGRHGIREREISANDPTPSKLLPFMGRKL